MVIPSIELWRNYGYSQNENRDPPDLRCAGACAFGHHSLPTLCGQRRCGVVAVLPQKNTEHLEVS